MATPKTLVEKIETAERLKEEGNAFVKQQNWAKALFAYHKAVLHVKGLGADGNLYANLLKGDKPQQEEASSDQKQDISKIMLALHLNMALCHFKQNKFDRVVDDCDKALALDRNNVKAYFRRGQAHLQMRDSDRAAADLNKAAELDPNDKAIQAEIRRLKQFEKAQLDKQKKAFAGLFDRMNASDE